MIESNGILMSDERAESLGMATAILAILDDNPESMKEHMLGVAVKVLTAWQERLRTGNDINLPEHIQNMLVALADAKNEEYRASLLVNTH